MKIIELTGERQTELDTEIRFHIATERAGGEELIRFDIADEVSLRLAIKLLRRMKSDGAVQVIAARDSFISEDTEASYIINKYGKATELLPDCEFVFVKI